METLPCTMIILLCNLFSLFNVDFKLLLTNKDSDNVFDLMNNILFFVLGMEYILMVMFFKNFVGSFFFYLDFLAFLSMIPDTKFLMDLLLPNSNDQHSMDTIDNLVRASSASQAGAK